MGKKRKLSREMEVTTNKSTETLKRAKKETFEEKLARSDPEFLKFLKDEGNNELLECDVDDLSDASSNEEDDEQQVSNDTDDGAEEDDVETEEEQSSDEDEKPPSQTAAVAAAAAAAAANKKKLLVTVKMVKEWAQELKESSSVVVMFELFEAFKAALQQTGKVSGDVCKYRVTGSTEFNAVIQCCLQDLVPALLSHLKLPESTDPNKPTLPSASPRWKKIRLNVKSYLTDIIQLLTCVGSAEVVRSILKHILDLVIFYVYYPKLKKLLMKKLVEVWSENENEQNRIVAFCSIHRLLRLSPETLLERTFKLMYAAYVRNTKFTSPTVLPVIQLMQRSLVEVARIDVSLTYKHSFVYIRQLAIHLRNAISVQKKETTQAVYNWQYIHCVSLWTTLICELNSDESMHSLVYPLTQIIIGTIKLVPTAQYYPLRFLCVRELNKLSLATSTFIPVLPFLTEVLDQLDWQHKVHGTAVKHFNFLCLLKLSKTQLHTKSFRDGVIDEVYELMFEHLNIFAHTISFPELALHAILQLRKFIKSCKVPAYTRRMKELLGKITETCSTITERRQRAALNLQDMNAVSAWESTSREAGTPLGKLYTTWKKLRDQQLKTETNCERLPKEKVYKQQEKKVRDVDESSDDSSVDFDVDEMEQLAKSASEDEQETQQEQERGKEKKKKTRKDKDVTNNRSGSKQGDIDSDDNNDEGDVVENMTLSDSDADNEDN